MDRKKGVKPFVARGGRDIPDMPTSVLALNYCGCGGVNHEGRGLSISRRPRDCQNPSVFQIYPTILFTVTTAAGGRSYPASVQSSHDVVDAPIDTDYLSV